MKTFPRRAVFAPLAIAFAGVAASHTLRAAESDTKRKRDPSMTGAGPRGSAVAPSTNPASPVTNSPTGTGARGSPVGPSTNPGQPRNPSSPKSE